jgi:hypothetical protein
VAYLYARNLKTGNRFVYYSIPEWLSPNCYERILIPCRQCIGCRLKYSASWGARILNESSLFDDNCFITLTYSNDKLPVDFSLKYKHFQDFMKRFRSHVITPKHKKKYGFCPDKIRFFMAGEYGDKYGRPHFHACVFNYNFPDRYYWTSSNGYKLYRSDLLDTLWSDPDDGINFGYSSIGTVTYDSAAYVARYCVKKRNGKMAPEYYRRLHVDEDTGELLDVIDMQPEFSHQSNRPGIGYEWFKKYYKTDIYTHDFIRVNGCNVVVPRYYDDKFKLELDNDFEDIKAKRKAKALLNADENDIHRLSVREEVQLAKADLLYRNLNY